MIGISLKLSRRLVTGADRAEAGKAGPLSGGGQAGGTGTRPQDDPAR